jgi:hypothetical protein
MKDLPHHIKKLNRRVVRSVHREEMDEEAFDLIPPRKQSERQIKKQAKERIRQEKNARAPSPLTPEERNRKMKNRVPVFDRLNDAKPKAALPSRKKTPRI